MSGPFVSDERFEIVVKYVEKENSSGVCSIVVANSDEIQERYGDQVKEIHTHWVQPNWKETNELIRKATSFDHQAGRRELDWVLYRQLMLETYMRSWDISFTSPEGKESNVPCAPENINRLDPVIAQELIQKFVDRTTVDEEELKN